MGYWKNLYTEQLMGYSTSKDVVTCKHCGKKYNQLAEEQTPGFRDPCDDICPYCNESNGTSMSYDYYNSKLEED